MPTSTSMFPSGFGDHPWLIKTPGLANETQTINPFKGFIEERKIPELDGQLCLSRFEEWLFLVDDLINDCFLLNIYSLEKINLPPIEDPLESIGSRILTSPPTSPDCNVVLLGREENFLLFCRPCHTKWTKLPVEFHATEADKMFAYNGKLYVLVEGIQIIDLASLSNNSYVETISISEPDFCSVLIVYQEHLLESCGDIFYVRTLFPDLEWSAIMDHEIFKLDFANANTWLRVESIGDRAFFLDSHGGQSFRAQDARLDQDCVYHVLPCFGGERIYKICLEDQTISYNLLPAEAYHNEFPSYWILPQRRPILKSELLTSSETVARTEVCQKGDHVKKYKVGEGAISMPFSSLPIEMVHSISEQLPLKDSGRLRTVCKPWSKLPNPIKENQVWLMYCPKKCGTCQMYNPFKGKQFTLNLKKLPSNGPTRFLFSKDGWVLALKGSNLPCLLNPFMNDFHRLPRLKENYFFNGIAFSSEPASSNCVVFAVVGGIAHIRVIVWHYGQEKWFEMEFHNNLPFVLADNNPVFFEGEFYCLGRRGNLGVFNPETNTWRILDKPSPIHSQTPTAEDCYLLECSGELISVFREINMDYVRVYKLDRSKMAWISLEDLGNLTLFLDHRTSIARALPCKTYSNKLYLPRLHDKANDMAYYYCMKSRMQNPNFNSFREPYNCVWLEPKLQ